MKEKSMIPKYIELVFDSLYLIVVVIVGIYLIASAKSGIRTLWGIMSLLLAFGDSFHLIPRMLVAVTGDKQRYQSFLGIGKMLTSITMAIFYLLLWHCGLMIFSLSLPFPTIVVYLLTAIRIILCLLPQNGWATDTPSGKINIYRNIPFFLHGIMVLALFARYGAALPPVSLMWLAILLSFAFYLPVVLYSDKNPKFGMLMLPKTCAYVWIVLMGLWL